MGYISKGLNFIFKEIDDLWTLLDGRKTKIAATCMIAINVFNILGMKIPIWLTIIATLAGCVGVGHGGVKEINNMINKNKEKKIPDGEI